MKLETVHIFAKIQGGLAVFKRVDIHRVEQIGVFAILDQAIDVELAGLKICEALNDELATRGSKQNG